ncbi:hypothetical protein DK419_13350 [Methylobacterium terrae]|uniref:Uncharacterized protein n=1 Tax=Methylobacterium terrae TaxID=2202827 RepID=A0A2U8WNT1_9HYPH|nr:hypothetical protein [Methylobacterium terrae]AWN47181.1 hypothetical protein DK419_13350 [Methylobacterium terrae]
MRRPAPLKPGQPDPLSDQFAAEYEAGDSFGRIAARYGLDHQRVARTLRRRPGFVQRDISEACRLPHRETMDRIAARARRELELLRPAPTFTPSAAAAGISTAIRRMRDRVRSVGPLCVDSPTVAAVHSAGLTLDDIAELFAVSPAEAARAIAAHAGR